MTKKERPLLVYFSGTGMTERLINKINVGDAFEVMRIKTGTEELNKPYILVTPTYMRGQVPKQVDRLLETNKPPVEVIGTGNRQWGIDFCGAGIKISERYNIPLIAKVEQSGHFNEVETVTDYFKTKYQMKVA